jgi:hypothetical protein
MKHNKEKFAQVITKAWMDPAFKERLIANPKKILEQEGVHCSSKNIEIVENTRNKSYLVLPEKPQGQLSEKEMREIAAAQCLEAMNLF